MEPSDRLQFLLKGLKDRLIFFKDTNFRAHACCQAQGEGWDEVLGSRILDWKICCSVSFLYSVTFTLGQKCAIWPALAANEESAPTDRLSHWDRASPWSLTCVHLFSLDGLSTGAHPIFGPVQNGSADVNLMFPVKCRIQKGAHSPSTIFFCWACTGTVFIGLFSDSQSGMSPKYLLRWRPQVR